MHIRKLLPRLAQSLLVVAIVGITLGATDPESRFNDLGHKMICQCSCSQVMLECNHVGCPVSPVMRNELSDGISKGMNDSLILQSFVQKYGAVVLAAPTTEGFDLLAWIMPFAVAFAGLLGTVLLVRHWAKQQPTLATQAARSKNPAQARFEDDMRERIRRETDTE
jgi:cytochrome c-type biogenesis protein CcmH